MNKTKYYLEALLKASKAKTIEKKLEYLTTGLKRIGWDKIGIFTYNDNMEIVDSFLTGITPDVVDELNVFRTAPLERTELIRYAGKKKSFYISWEDALSFRGMDVKALYRKLSCDKSDDPLGLLVFLRSNYKVVGSMHLLKNNRHGWDEALEIIELYANYAAYIIEEYRLKQQIEKTARKYRTVFESSLDPIVVTDRERKISLCNKRFLKMTGRKESELLNCDFRSLISGNTRFLDKALMDAANGVSSEVVTKIINRKREEIPVRIFIRLQQYGDSVPQIELVIDDLRSDIDLQKSARMNERSYKLIFENASEGIALFTLSGNFISCNPAGLKQIGYTEKEILGKNFDKLVEDRIKSIARRYFDRTARGVPFSNKYFSIVKKDGSRNILAISSAPFRSYENEIIGVMLISRDITSEIEAFKAKEKSEKEYRQILEQLPDIYYHCSKDGKIIYISTAAKRLLGYNDTKSLIGKPLIETLCYDKEEAIKTRNKLYEQGTIISSPLYFKKRNGEALYCEVNAHLVYDENGEVIGSEGTVRDESRRKAVEKALADSAEQLNTITRNLPIGIYRTTTDPTGKSIFLSPAFASIFGYDSVEEMKNVPVVDLYYEPHLRRDLLKLLNKEGSLRNVEYRMYKKNRDIIWISDTCFIVQDDAGKAKYIDGIIEDITYKKELEAELKESEKRYRLIAENVSDVIWILDLGLRYTYISPSVKQLRGYEPEELIGNHIKESLTTESYEVIDKIFKERMGQLSRSYDDTQFQPITLEIEMLHKNGSTLWTEIKAVILWDKKNKPVGIQGVTRDISARKRAEEALADQLMLLDDKVKERTRELAKTNEELLRSNRVKSEFLANISHELRSPLTSILGYAEMMLGNDAMDREMKNYLEIINSQGNQLLRLVDSLLDIAKYESGTLKLVLVLTDVNKIIKTVEEHLQIKLEKSKLTLKTNLDSKIREVNLDSQKIYQIIRNLVDNAIKFSPENKEIFIESRLLESEIRVRVRDQGIGISEKHLFSIFDPFYQVDSSSTRSYEGAGLGLHLVKNFVNLHHGRIWVESERNKGTTFTVCFPTNLQRPLDTGAQTEGAAAIRIIPSEEKYKILFVDDDSEISNLVKIMLKHQYIIIPAKNGKEGVEIALEIKPDLILMDLSMPVLDGYEATKILKTRAETLKIPVIALSARAMKSEIEKALQVGCDAHLAKPFKFNELISIINKFLK